MVRALSLVLAAAAPLWAAAQGQCSLASSSSSCGSLGDCQWCKAAGYCAPRSETCEAVKRASDNLITGLVAATFTPFDEDLEIDTTQVYKQAAWLNATGVKWVFVSGTTGESVKLTLAERMAQAELWITVAKQYGLRTIVHVGSESIDTARLLAQHAEKHGADAFAAMPPVFFQPANTEALARTMASVASAAPTLPFLYYHIPSMTHVAFPDGMFGFVQEMDKANVGNFRGVKYTGLYTYPGFMDVSRIINYKGGKYEVLSGARDDRGHHVRHHRVCRVRTTWSVTSTTRFGARWRPATSRALARCSTRPWS